MLFAPPQPPLRIDAEREFVIGRGASCDLTVESPRASRSHAAVRHDGEIYSVRDLGSTNGTFVNGDRLDSERTLKPGDHIEIGDVDVTFCCVDGDFANVMGSPARERTVVMTRTADGYGEVLRGDLDRIPSFAVLQMLEMGGQTGVLTIEGENGAAASLWLVDGHPFHARTGTLEGFDAAVAIVRTESGCFRFEPESPPGDRTIESTVTHVLLEASRLSDEESR